MSDKEILRKLNNESKKLINDFYSIASFINKNKSNLEYPSIKDMDELITYSCFLATIKNDNVISSFLTHMVLLMKTLLICLSLIMTYLSMISVSKTLLIVIC